MNEQTIGSGDGASRSIGSLLGNMEEGLFTGDFEGQASYQGLCRIRLWKWVSLSVRNLGGSVSWEL